MHNIRTWTPAQVPVPILMCHGVQSTLKLSATLLNMWQQHHKKGRFSDVRRQFQALEQLKPIKMTLVLQSILGFGVKSHGIWFTSNLTKIVFHTLYNMMKKNSYKKNQKYDLKNHSKWSNLKDHQYSNS